MKRLTIITALLVALGTSAALASVPLTSSASTTNPAPISAPMRTVLLPPIPAPPVTPVTVAAPPAAATVAPAAVEAPTSGEVTPVQPAQALPVQTVASASTAVAAPVAPPVTSVTYCNVEAVTSQTWPNPNEDGSTAPAGTTGGGEVDCSDVATFESSFPPGTTFTVTQGDPITQTTSAPGEQRQPLP